MPKLIEWRDEKPIYKRRCRNCKKPFKTDRPDKHFCEKSCRYEWHNYGKTPQAQMEGRLKAYMKTYQFREMVREEVRRAAREMVAGSNSAVITLPVGLPAPGLR